MISLSPRYDLFKFEFPKDFLPDEIESKYAEIINKDACVISKPIDYLNESIQGVTFPGISDLLIEQDQQSKRLGYIEPVHKNSYLNPTNPLNQIEKEIKVTFRMNQGLYNYFMLYETAFHQSLKYKKNEKNDVFYIDILNETGNICARLTLFQCYISGIEGLEFSYSKVERGTDTFNVTFKFNNIDFDIVEKY